ncbi:MAG: transcriptional repressor [Hydrogenoanaerobacterium sp.]
MKYSRPRELVMNAVVNNPVHPTADYVYSHLREENPNISLGTVYRNLNLLAEHGLIHKIPIPNGSDRFDFRIDEHYHIICEKCGAVLDVEISELSKLDKQIEQSTHFEVTGHSIIISGLCKNCQ